MGSKSSKPFPMIILKKLKLRKSRLNLGPEFDKQKGTLVTY